MKTTVQHLLGKLKMSNSVELESEVVRGLPRELTAAELGLANGGQIIHLPPDTITVTNSKCDGQDDDCMD